MILSQTRRNAFVMVEYVSITICRQIYSFSMLSASDPQTLVVLRSVCLSVNNNNACSHHIDVIMGTIASHIISLTIVYSTVHSDTDQRKHQSSASLAFLRVPGEFPAQMASNAENVCEVPEYFATSRRSLRMISSGSIKLHKIINSLCYRNYHQISNISRTTSQNLMFLVSSCICLCPIHWSQVLSREWRCSWSSAGRRCSKYIWVINNFTAR